jgi:hypothetical protein
MTATRFLGVPIVVLTPGLVDVLKRSGLPVRYAGVAAIACAGLLAALGDVAGDGAGMGLPLEARLATWALAGIVYGLAAGLSTQDRALATDRPANG